MNTNDESDLYLCQGVGLSQTIDTIAVEEESTEVLSEICPDLIVIDAERKVR